MIPLETIILQGIQEKAAAYFKLAKAPLLLSTSDRYRVLRELSSKGEDISYPIVFLTLDSVATPQNNERYNTRTMAREGIFGKLNAGTPATVDTIQMIPVNFSMTMIYLDQDFYATVAYARRWMFAATTRGLNFNVVYDDITIPIKVVAAQSVAIPTKDNTVDLVNVYDFDSTLEVWGFMANVDQDPVQTPIITDIQLNPQVQLYQVPGSV